MSESSPEDSMPPRHVPNPQNGTILDGAHAESVASRMLKLIAKIAGNEIQKYKRGKLFVFPFFVTEEHLNIFDKDIVEAMNLVPINSSLEFLGTVEYSDLSCQQFVSMADFLSRAGKRKDPRSIQLNWSKFSINDRGEVQSGRVELGYVTEKRLTNEKNNPGVIRESVVSIEVSGSLQNWVNELFDDLCPIVESTAHGGMMRPFWIFRNPFVVQISSLLCAWMSLIYASAYIDRFFERDFVDEESLVLRKINSASTIEQMFKTYMNWHLTPNYSDPSALAGLFLVKIGVFITIMIFSRYLIPKLTPNSSVAIGISRQRAGFYIDTFKWIVFSVVIAGFLIPMIRALIDKIFK